MKIYIEKIGMIRPLSNPKNCDLNLEMDWSIDYVHEDQNQIEYICILKSIYLDLNLKIEGILQLEDCEMFVQDNCSKIILDNSFEILMKMFSLTRQSSYVLSDIEADDYFVREDIHSALYN